MNVCVVIPVYNSPYILEVIKDVIDYGYKIIVVDDGSDVKVDIGNTDIELITHEVNMGKGEAILSGALRAKELGFESFVTMDADKQHISKEIAKLVEASEVASK